MELRAERCTLWLFQDITARRHSEMELVDAIEAVMKDASWFSRSVMDKLATLRNPRGGEPSRPVVELSPREREVLGFICEGLDDRTIAERLGLSGNTVRNHVARVYAKIGVTVAARRSCGRASAGSPDAAGPGPARTGAVKQVSYIGRFWFVPVRF